MASLYTDCGETQSGTREGGAGMDRIDPWQKVPPR